MTILTSKISNSAGTTPDGDVFDVVLPNRITIRVGAVHSLRALGLFENNVWANATSEVSWASQDEGVVTVEDNGKITGVSEGQTIVTAEGSDEALRGHCLVTVISADPLSTGTPVGKGVIEYGYGDEHPSFTDDSEATLPVGFVNKVLDHMDQMQRTGTGEQGQVPSGVQAPVVREEPSEENDNP